jgi:hypothetical protein
MSAYGGSFTNCRFEGIIVEGTYYAVGPMDGHGNGSSTGATSGEDDKGNTWVVPWYGK